MLIMAYYNSITWMNLTNNVAGGGIRVHTA